MAPGVETLTEWEAERGCEAACSSNRHGASPHTDTHAATIADKDTQANGNTLPGNVC